MPGGTNGNTYGVAGTAEIGVFGTTTVSYGVYGTGTSITTDPFFMWIGAAVTTTSEVAAWTGGLGGAVPGTVFFHLVTDPGAPYAPAALLSGCGSETVGNYIAVHAYACSVSGALENVFFTFVLYSGDGTDQQSEMYFCPANLAEPIIADTRLVITKDGLQVPPIVAGSSLRMTLTTYGIQGYPVIEGEGAQTHVSGSTSGDAYFSQPHIGPNYKKVVVRLTALVGTASYTFPNSFTDVPAILTTNQVGAAVVTSLSASAMTVTGATTSGFLFLEGY